MTNRHATHLRRALAVDNLSLPIVEARRRARHHLSQLLYISAALLELAGIPRVSSRRVAGVTTHRKAPAKLQLWKGRGLEPRKSVHAF